MTKQNKTKLKNKTKQNKSNQNKLRTPVADPAVALRAASTLAPYRQDGASQLTTVSNYPSHTAATLPLLTTVVAGGCGCGCGCCCEGRCDRGSNRYHRRHPCCCCCCCSSPSPRCMQRRRQQRRQAAAVTCPLSNASDRFAITGGSTVSQSAASAVCSCVIMRQRLEPRVTQQQPVDAMGCVIRREQALAE